MKKKNLGTCVHAISYIKNKKTSTFIIIPIATRKRLLQIYLTFKDNSKEKKKKSKSLIYRKSENKVNSLLI